MVTRYMKWMDTITRDKDKDKVNVDTHCSGKEIKQSKIQNSIFMKQAIVHICARSTSYIIPPLKLRKLSNSLTRNHSLARMYFNCRHHLTCQPQEVYYCDSSICFRMKKRSTTSNTISFIKTQQPLLSSPNDPTTVTSKPLQANLHLSNSIYISSSNDNWQHFVGPSKIRYSSHRADL